MYLNGATTCMTTMSLQTKLTQLVRLMVTAVLTEVVFGVAALVIAGYLFGTTAFRAIATTTSVFVLFVQLFK